MELIKLDEYDTNKIKPDDLYFFESGKMSNVVTYKMFHPFKWVWYCFIGKTKDIEMGRLEP